MAGLLRMKFISFIAFMMLQIMAAQQVGKFDKALPVLKHSDPSQPLLPVPEGRVYVANKGGTFQICVNTPGDGRIADIGYMNALHISVCFLL